MATYAPQKINADTLTQFALIQEIDAIFDIASINFWLRGGWALDFLLGRITRAHSDIDLVTWKYHSSQVQELLTRAGFAFDRDLGIQMDFVKASQDISVCYVAETEDNRIFTPDIPEWIWVPKALALPPYQLEGLSCDVISPEQMLDEKETYEEGTGRPPRPKDRYNIEILKQLIAEGRYNQKG